MIKFNILLKLMLISSGLIFIISCEKDITVDLPKYEQKIVVEGWIEQNQFPMVILTKSSPYFSSVDSTALAELIIPNATVIVSDGSNSDTLSLVLDTCYFPPLVYKGHTLKGQIGGIYYLTIKYEEKILTATTSIPQPIPLDSIWFKAEPKKGDSLGFIWAHYTDPQETGNCYKIFTKRLGKDNKFIPIFGSIYEDSYFNGKELVFSMSRGIQSYINEEEYTDDPELGYFKINDTIVVKNCSINKNIYDFWRTTYQVMFSGDNPFVPAIIINTNIKGGGLGVWGGYGASYDTIIAK